MDTLSISRKDNHNFKVWMLLWAFSIFGYLPAFAQSTVTYTAGDYRTTTAGSLGQTAGTSLLEQLTAQGVWVPATYPLPTTATLYIEHPTQLSGTLQVTNLTLNAQKTLTIPAGAKLIATTKLALAPSAELLQEGEIENRGLLQLQSNSRLIIKSLTYRASSLIWSGTEEMDATSEVRIEAAAANALLFSGSHLSAQAHGFWFGRLTLAPTQAGSQWQLTDANAPLAAQAFHATIPATSSLVLLGASNLSLQFGQDVSLTGGAYYLQNQSSGTGIVNVAGHLALQGATLALNQTSNATVTSILDLKGNLLVDAASVINNSSTVSTSSSGIRFSGTNWQTLQATGPINHVSLVAKAGAMVRLGQHLRLNPSNSVYAGTFTVENGAALDFGVDANNTGYQVQGQGYFNLNQGGTLYITSAQGINTTGATGNVVVTESRRTFHNLATFIYNAKIPQQTGNAFIATASGKIVVMDNPTSVTITKNIGISSSKTQYPTGGRLEIKQGTLISTASTDITGTGALVMSGGTYQIGTLNVSMVPQLSGTYTLTNGTIELTGAGAQTLRGDTYNNVTVGGSNDAKTISSTTTINQNLTILPNAVFDISNKTLKGEGGLTMTGGLFRTSKTSNTLPELTGKNMPYNITGGTIEFYGSINGQSQSIRGTYGNSQKVTYNNLLLTATETNTMNDLGNHLLTANFDVTGTLTVKAPAALQMATNRAVGGTGNFIVEDGATLLYGSPQGIKMTGTGTSDGNVRVSGTRSFSPNANYGFIGNSEMVSGDALPSTVQNLLVAKTNGSGVTLSKNVTVSGVFTMRSSLFKTEGYELSLLSQAESALQFADSTFYIQGTLRRAVGSSGIYSFPIGNAAGKRNLDLVSIGLAGNGFQSIAVEFKPIINHQDTDMFLTEGSYSYTHIAPEGVWYVEPNAKPITGSFTATASLQGFNNLSDNKFALLARQANSTSGKDWSTGGGTLDAPNKEGRTVAGGYAKRNFMTQFGQLAIATMESVLPVSWLYVKAERKNQEVQLQWATATEINNDHFEVEFSQDGKTFTQAGIVKGAGNSSVQKDYSFDHQSSAKGTAYYRVKQVDLDGKFEYSKVVAVQGGGAALAQITLYPNPSHDFLHLGNVTLDPTALVEILDAQGRQVNKIKPVMEGATPKIPVQQLPSGNYILRVKNASQLIQQRFVKF
ncbi:T9SS type A sorting domain-containing protein [Rufibacter hautae]|uniref:T9SS type A sorting domain-containing protein n=1 Tax=Rufibacter hautae TaxID=2595005 RepID=A0A5B6TEB2_9BACT|nr:T9SS type A sorting domain-containing protein [Rufibacter hautae]KAA3437724.1 T9SS type A sorting domain-containing protein [Rufibacter hautae]